MSDELSGTGTSSMPPSFDFDDDAIASLLDNFVETQTGDTRKASSHPPDPDDAGAQAAHRTVFRDASRHEVLPLVGDTADVRRRRIELLRALAERAVGSTRARLLCATAEQHEQLGDAEAAAGCYASAAESDARDVVVLRALRRHATRRADWSAAAAALQKEAALDLAEAERASALKLLAQIELSKLGDAAAAEQSATRASELVQDDFVAWLIAAGARLLREQHQRAAEALVCAAERWPAPDAKSVLLSHAADLMEQASIPKEARSLYERVIELQPESLRARLGIVRASRLLGDLEAAEAALLDAARHAPFEIGAALRRTAAVLACSTGRSDDALSLLEGAQDDASGWTRFEVTSAANDLRAASDALGSLSEGGSPDLRALAVARRARLAAELDEPQERLRDAPPWLDAYLESLEVFAGAEHDAESAPELPPIDGPSGAKLLVDEAALEPSLQAFLDGLWEESSDANGATSFGVKLAVMDVSGAELDATMESFSALDLSAAEEQANGRDDPAALWSTEENAESRGERAQAAARQAAIEPGDPTLHHLRAALWAVAPEEQVSHAEAALDRSAPDPLLIEHLFQAAGARSEAAGDLMMLAARTLGGSSYLVRAAEAYHAAGQPALAARALRQAEDDAEDHAALRVRRQDAELQAGEFARLADAAMQRARSAANSDQELRAFAAMAEVDRLARRDMQSARLSLQSIAEARPDHIPTLRALEWDALRAQDPERIRASAKRLLEALPEGTADRVARWRLIVEVMRADADLPRSEVDRVLRSIREPIDADPSLARQALGAAYERDETDLGVQSLIALQAALGSDLERATLALEAAGLLQRDGDPARALEALNTAGNHPLALEAEAELLRESKRWEDAAAAFGESAGRAKDTTRGAALWREAACIYEETLDDSARAVETWEAAARADITYGDVYRRLGALYRAAGREDDLRVLIDARIEAGADTPTLVGLLLDKAAHRRALGDLDGVVDALTESLELDPFHFAALQELVEACRLREDWQGASEALIRIARLKRNVDEQVWAFTELAGIYHEHLADLPRAEASLRRALELAPGHTETMDRLASVLTQEDKPREAARLLYELAKGAAGEEEQRDYRIRLAAAVEKAGEARHAEGLLEQLRSERRTDPDVILAVADYYSRQGAGPAESMHLNRAANDLREAIQDAPGDEGLWTTLVRVLNRRHGPGAASCAASAAIAVGHPALLFEGDVTQRGEALGEPNLPLAAGVDAVVAPAGLPQAARRLFTLCEHGFDKMLPFDAGAWRLRRPSSQHRVLVEEVGAVAEALGISEPKLRVTYIAPSSCMPIGGDPPTLVVGGNLHETTTPEERVFLFARALKVAASHMAPALRARPEELDTALLALLQDHDPSRTRGRGSLPLGELRKKLIKAVPRRWRDEVESLVLELRGHSAFSTRLVPFAVSSLGDRVALTLRGDVPSAVSALLKAAGHEVPVGHPDRAEAVRQTPEAWALVRFAISDAHFEARAQAGVDR